MTGLALTVTHEIVEGEIDIFMTEVAILKDAGGDSMMKDSTLMLKCPILMVKVAILRVWKLDFKRPGDLSRDEVAIFGRSGCFLGLEGAEWHPFFQIRGKEVTKAENVTKKEASHVLSLAMLRN